MTTYDDLMELQEQAIAEEYVKEHGSEFSELVYD